MKKIIQNNIRAILIIFVITMVLTTGCITQEVSKDLQNAQKEVSKDLQNAQQEVSKDLQNAQNDYAWKLDLVKEQTTRLDMYYATKAGVMMTEQEFSGWLNDLKGQTREVIKRNNDAIVSGRVYVELLNAEVQNLNYDEYNREYDRVVKNEEIMKNNIQIAETTYNQNVAKYNSRFVRWYTNTKIIDYL